MKEKLKIIKVKLNSLFWELDSNENSHSFAKLKD